MHPPLNCTRLPAPFRLRTRHFKLLGSFFGFLFVFVFAFVLIFHFLVWKSALWSPYSSDDFACNMVSFYSFTCFPSRRVHSCPRFYVRTIWTLIFILGVLCFCSVILARIEWNFQITLQFFSPVQVIVRCFNLKINGFVLSRDFQTCLD